MHSYTGTKIFEIQSYILCYNEITEHFFQRTVRAYIFNAFGIYFPNAVWQKSDKTSWDALQLSDIAVKC